MDLDSVIPIKQLGQVANQYGAILSRLEDDPRDDASTRAAVKSVRTGKLLFLILHALGIKRTEERIMAPSDSPAKTVFEQRVVTLSNGGILTLMRTGSRFEKKHTDVYTFHLDPKTRLLVKAAVAEVEAVLPQQ